MKFVAAASVAAAAVDLVQRQKFVPVLFCVLINDCAEWCLVTWHNVTLCPRGTWHARFQGFQHDFCLQVTELLHQLREFITTFVSAFTSKQEQDRAEAEFTATLNAFIDPALQMCKSNAASLSGQRYRQPFICCRAKPLRPSSTGYPLLHCMQLSHEHFKAYCWTAACAHAETLTLKPCPVLVVT